MEEAATCGIFILLFDAVLCSALWAALVLLGCSGCGGLVGVWACGAVKWAVMHVFTSALADGKPPAVLRRLVALLCLLSPVFESGRFLAASFASESYQETPPVLGALLLGPSASTLACVVWEMGLCGNAKRRKEDDKLDARRLLLRMLKYFKADALYVAAAFGFLILGVFCDTFIPLYQGKVIDMLRGQELHAGFCYAIGQLGLLSVGSAVFSGLRGGTFMCTLARLNRRLKHLLFHTLLQQEVHFFEENQPGSLSSRLHSDVDRMGRTVALNANALVRSTVKMCLMLAVMLKLSWELTVLTCVEMPLLVVMQNFYNSRSSVLKQQIQDCKAHNKDLATQTVRWIHTVRSFRAEGGELRRYRQALEKQRAANARLDFYRIVFLFVRRLVTVGMKLFMLIQARSLMASGRLSVGSLVSFLLYQKPMSHNLREILFCYGETMSTVRVISKVFGYLDRTPRCKAAGDLAPEKLEGRIVFQNVTLTYPSAAAADKPALKSVCIEVRPGKMTALVGPSGSGKSSCLSLLKRLYEPQDGRILLDGAPLHSYKHKYLHEKVALVSQSPGLFSGSVRYNIEYGLQGCTSERVRDAARTASAHDFISALENGYDADIGEGGGRVAKGLQHRIAVARALIRDPQVVILDETSGKVDVEVWNAVLREVLSRGRTVLAVAHKLKSVEEADHIVFLEKGEVVEEGTHRELTAKRGRFYQFSQSPQ